MRVSVHYRFVRDLLLLMSLVSASVVEGAAPLRPDTGLIAPWTKPLRDRQPGGPYVLVYRKGPLRLIFVAAEHENALNSPTFHLINQAFTLWPISSIIVEGTSAALGPNPPELMAIATRLRRQPGLDPDGETSPAVRNAVKMGAQIYGGEADDLEVRNFARKAGIKDVDLLGYYVLRVIPHWRRDGSISGPADPALKQLVEKQIARSAAELKISPTVMPSFISFASWYERTNRKTLSAGSDQEETGPLVDGRWPTMGRPCYSGGNMAAAAKSCAADRKRSHS